MPALTCVLVRVVGDCTEPIIGDGWLIRVDTSRVEPPPSDVVAVHIEGAGNVIGYEAVANAPLCCMGMPLTPRSICGRAASA
jgi:hypothetical protein